MWSGGVVFCKDKTMGRKQPELPRCPHETISFRLGFNSRDLEIKKGNRRSGRRFLKAASQQDFSGPVSFAASLSLPLPPLLLWGNKHISKDELRSSHWRMCFTFWKPGQLQAYFVSTLDERGLSVYSSF